jgi:SAM-dependent methyltransferase
MPSDGTVGELALNPETEEAARQDLRQHYQRLHFWNVEGSVESSMSLAGCYDRFAYLESILPERALWATARCLISGSSAGSEMWVARREGFLEVYGVEVDPFFAELCTRRFQPFSGLFTLLYNGENLPCADSGFDLVVSGHVIEHTQDPGRYLEEHLRVLKVGGYFYLEFPSRFHYKELHTGLPSLEWLPQRWRNALLRLLSSRYSPLRQDVKHRMEAIVSTYLQQISMGGISKCLSSACYKTQVIHRYRPVPGVVRCIIQRVA